MATRRRERGFASDAVAAVFGAYDAPVRERLLRLRGLILDTAANTEGVGALEETLKWGQPSYLTSQSKSGSTIRIDQVRTSPGCIALYVHCQTSLVETFRGLYPDELKYDGKRAILVDPADEIPEAELRHCIALALTYHRRKARQRQSPTADPAPRGDGG